MAGQSTKLSRSESISMQRAIEYGPNKTMGGTSPNRGSGEMNVKVPTNPK
ncbi:MAG TPA: hypothetical protein VGF75_05560 [Candidatus Saccharimonadales bacterium]|jgi:hypothetical protein